MTMHDDFGAWFEASWQAAYRAGFSVGLEQAANVCDVERDKYGVPDMALGLVAQSCAAAIRALKEKP